MLILTLAFATARLSSFIMDTLTQKIPESLKKCRRMSWQSEVGLTALQMVVTGTWQSASDTTVHTSVGRLERGGKVVNSPSAWILCFHLRVLPDLTFLGRKRWNQQHSVPSQLGENHQLQPPGQFGHSQCPLRTQTLHYITVITLLLNIQHIQLKSNV